jgi:hypothetical protein
MTFVRLTALLAAFSLFACQKQAAQKMLSHETMEALFDEARAS